MNEAIIIGSAVFVIGAGTTSLKMVLNWYLEEKKRADGEREKRITQSIDSLEKSGERVRKDVGTLGLKLAETDKRLDRNTVFQERLERENHEILSMFHKMFSFMASPDGAQSEVIELKPGIYMVKKKKGPPGA